MSQVITPQMASNGLKFLNRADLKGSETLEMLELMQVLSRIANDGKSSEPEGTPAPEE